MLCGPLRPDECDRGDSEQDTNPFSKTVRLVELSTVYQVKGQHVITRLSILYLFLTCTTLYPLDCCSRFEVLHVEGVFHANSHANSPNFRALLSVAHAHEVGQIKDTMPEHNILLKHSKKLAKRQ